MALLLAVAMMTLCGDESERPMPKLEILRQGLHPNPGPVDPKLVSVWSDPYWEKCGWTPPTAEVPAAKESGKRAAAGSEGKALDFLGGTAEWRSKLCKKASAPAEPGKRIRVCRGDPLVQCGCRGCKEAVIGSEDAVTAAYADSSSNPLRTALKVGKT